MSHPVIPGSSGSGRDDDDRFDLRSHRGDNPSTHPPPRASSAASSNPSPSTYLPPTRTNIDSGDDGDRAVFAPSDKVLIAQQDSAPAPTVVVSEDEPADLLTQEKNEFGGIKIGAALLGWLTTVGTIAVLAAILAAIASGLNLDRNTSTADLKGVGLGAAIALLVVLFLGYLAGGYVAGRMARFHGIRQGLAVWLWGLLIAIVLSITAAIVGSQSTILVQVNLPQIPFTASGFTWQAVLALLAVLVVTLFGAMLGGLMGMHFHRRIDKFVISTETV